MIEDDTLVIVTSDHSHTMVLPGYTGRDTEFPGLLGKNSDDGKFETSIGKSIQPMLCVHCILLFSSFLAYINGPGGFNNSYKLDDKGRCTRVDPKNHDITDMKYKFPALIPKGVETHASDDVALWATGNTHLCQIISKIQN